MVANLGGPQRGAADTGSAGRVVRIAGASGAWGDSPLALGQVLGAEIDYVIMDFLAEVTMSLLARARMKDPDGGYPGDFVANLKDHLGTLHARGIKVVSNAGGINPLACKAAVERMLAEAGVDLTVAAVVGDDVLPAVSELRREHVKDVSGEELRDDLLTANAYLGAVPIAEALAAGADIVITGRCADSALALGILMHEYGWTTDDHDLLAAGSLVGHVLECGPHATGGIFTDWEEVPGWHNIGYPIAECRTDGTFVVTKPDGTGGMIDQRCIAEQVLYEVGDPAAYILPDVIADFSQVKVRQLDADHVEVSGTIGRPPTSSYKVSATYQDGHRMNATVSIVGSDAVRKAQKTGEAIIMRARMIFEANGWPDFVDYRIEALGGDSSYGPTAQAASATREVIARVGMVHESVGALNRVAKEVGSLGLTGAPGTTGLLGGRPRPVPHIKLSTFYVDKGRLEAPLVLVGDQPAFPIVVPGGVDDVAPTASSGPQSAVSAEDQEHDGPTVSVPLIRLAHARSGDKADTVTMGLIARRPEFLPLIRRQVTSERMAAHFRELVEGPVERFDVPGLGAVQFLFHDALGGGGMASLRLDPQGKAFGQMALEMLVEVPTELASQHGW